MGSQTTCPKMCFLASPAETVRAPTAPWRCGISFKGRLHWSPAALDSDFGCAGGLQWGRRSPRTARHRSACPPPATCSTERHCVCTTVTLRLDHRQSVSMPQGHCVCHRDSACHGETVRLCHTEGVMASTKESSRKTSRLSETGQNAFVWGIDMV